MQNQFAMLLAAMFGLTQCTEKLEKENAEAEPTAELAGTWMEIRTTQDNAGAWQSTERKTIIITGQGASVQFFDCLDDTRLTANVVGTSVSLPSADYPRLQLEGGNRLVSFASVGTTQVELRRLSTSTQPVLASFAMSAPQPNSDWSRLCLQTFVSASEPDQLSVKASNDPMGAVVGVTFTMAESFVAGQFTYPHLDNDVSGTFAITGLATGDLSNPDGTLVISESDTLDLQADLTMDNSATGSGIGLSGLLQVGTNWLESP